jgi:hypothetical protein
LLENGGGPHVALLWHGGPRGPLGDCLTNGFPGGRAVHPARRFEVVAPPHLPSRAGALHALLTQRVQSPLRIAHTDG